jgi:hypothetical protein
VPLPPGVAYVIYFFMGLFGASLYGQDTQGNIMVNHIVQGRGPILVLYGTMLLYLSLGMTTTQFALRQSLDLMFVGEGAPFTWARQLSMTTLTVGETPGRAGSGQGRCSTSEDASTGRKQDCTMEPCTSCCLLGSSSWRFQGYGTLLQSVNSGSEPRSLKNFHVQTPNPLSQAECHFWPSQGTTRDCMHTAQAADRGGPPHNLS